MLRTVVAVCLGALCCVLPSACKGSGSNPEGSGAGGGGGATGSGGVTGSGGATGTGGVSGSGGTSGGAGASTSGSAGMGAPGISSGPPTFSHVWSDVIVRKSCNSAFCHGMGQGNLWMRNKDDAHMNLINVMAAGPKCGMSGMLRVKPGDPTQSLLMDKVSHSMPACGDPMPIGTRFPPDCLSQDPAVCNIEPETTLVRDWIAAGALND